jgi:hypothetical protein
LRGHARGALPGVCVTICRIASRIASDLENILFLARHSSSAASSDGEITRLS